ncbi:HNHc domain containing protein [uncultured Caudovirales phage]|uniref:HNHc domain containing protein n=1 Tax=uncultured Caudovirales phage TaxID=2100421 RepID=A0A6J5PXJ2_9CAUD|nr:HNHc domain containing protein [uncultured Caudovirales phage]CAB4183168.1 HNHc domain containing protein [uncultured Caudovirales phage]CAB4197783.1 HNHc domain containing protein [uncultured Caudovirales phage]CAB4211352.1 HNHc domain containing protein [uncultured Caudovirales phage]CAB5238026.1 HNHc domain containing protein [uncultured Caudovirales phage]
MTFRRQRIAALLTTMLLGLLLGYLKASPSPSPSATRSSHWPAVRKQHLAKFPTCAACGATSVEEHLEVHHVKPFHLDPSLELLPENLITLCRTGRDDHFHLGHDPDGPGPLKPSWRSENKNVRQDSANLLKRLGKN